LIDLDKKKEEVKRFFEELDEATKAVQAELGMDGHFQDTDGTVYQIVKPEGTFIQYKDVSYIRTRREGEKKGGLSLTKARDLGYEVEGK
jgi:hypothetical protein